MESEKNSTTENNAVTLEAIILENELKKEEKIVDLVIRIIVRTTLEEYYETCNTISAVQPDRAK